MKLVPGLTKHDRFLREVRSHLIGSPVSVQRHDNTWTIELVAPFLLSVEGMWRLIGKTYVLATSEDDGHQFGLPAPLDVEEKANTLLSGKVIQQIELDRRTGDLRFEFDDSLVLEIVTTSMGYETWQVWKSDELFAVGANGGLVT